jgi:hypothetical protein
MKETLKETEKITTISQYRQFPGRDANQLYPAEKYTALLLQKVIRI